MLILTRYPGERIYDNITPDEIEPMCEDDNHRWIHMGGSMLTQAYGCPDCETYELRYKGAHIRYVDRSEALRSCEP